MCPLLFTSWLNMRAHKESYVIIRISFSRIPELRRSMKRKHAKEYEELKRMKKYEEIQKQIRDFANNALQRIKEEFEDQVDYYKDCFLASPNEFRSYSILGLLNSAFEIKKPIQKGEYEMLKKWDKSKAWPNNFGLEIF